MIRTLKKLKFEYTSLVAREPMLAPLYWPNIWWQQYKIWHYYKNKGASLKECFVHQGTEFVLDGFQGSANSFAADAFLASQDQTVHVAHHMHAPAQIIKAVRRSIPTMVTIREPYGTVLSLTSRWPYVSVHQALRSYIGFYRKLEPYRDGYVLSPFDQTTEHLDRAIQQVNDRFGTDFDIYDASLQKMQARHGPEKASAAEKQERDARKARKAEELDSPECLGLLHEANALHHRMTQSVEQSQLCSG